MNILKLFSKKAEFRKLTIDECQELTRILIIDDQDKDSLIKSLSDNHWKARQIKDVDDYFSHEIKDAHIIFVDIIGIGKTLHKEEEGLDIAYGIKTRHLEKKVIIYSRQAQQNFFHAANNVVDGRIRKIDDPEEFLKTVEKLSQLCFDIDHSIESSFALLYKYLPSSVSKDEFSKLIKTKVLNKKNISEDLVSGVLGIGIEAAKIVVPLLIQAKP